MSDDRNFTIIRLDLLKYLEDFEKLRTALSDFFVKTRDCTLFGLYDESMNASALLVSEYKSECDIEILFLASEDDSIESKKYLICYLTDHLPACGTITWRIPDTDSNKEIAAEFDFTCEYTVNLFRSVGAKDARLIETFKENEKLLNYMMKFGYKTVNFDELTEDELLQIRTNPDGEFESSLHPEVLMADTVGGFSPKFSFASVRGGKVAAYTIIRCPDGKHCIFEIICVAKSFRCKGVFILPFLYTLKTMDEYGIESGSFAIYEVNRPALQIVEKRFSQLIVSHTIQHNYVYTGK